MTERAETLLAVCLACYAGGALLSLLFHFKERLANALGFGLASAGGLSGLGAAILALQPNAEVTTLRVLPNGLPFVELTARLDPLAAFFLLIMSLLALALNYRFLPIYER